MRSIWTSTSCLRATFWAQCSCLLCNENSRKIQVVFWLKSFFLPLLWKWLLDCKLTSVCQIRFTWEARNETRVILFESQWKTNNKWDVDCWRLCWHILHWTLNLKALECVITALESERSHSIWRIHCGGGLIHLTEVWSGRHEHPSSIHLSGLWSICDCWPICVTHPQQTKILTGCTKG